ncbi:MAG: hypothetical protein M1817_002152 [Caeruleum heppii]|nr:MAG: hypothetical protein M1817_002152 [Caeruleum heppii]
MAHRWLLRQRVALPAAAAALTAGTVFFPPRIAHAEEPRVLRVEKEKGKKPIYDDPVKPSFSLRSHHHPDSDKTPTISSSSSQPTGPTPTDRLALHVRRARLFLHAHAAAGEEKLNSVLTSFFHLENSFTSTVASLAPPPASDERLMPGMIYVLVAGLTGSIISRNRNILLRATVPVALGVGAGWVVIPLTMRNVSDLLWTYEERVPVISENHLRVRGAVQEMMRAAKARKDDTLRFVDEKVQDGRTSMEDWVKKGR